MEYQEILDLLIKTVLMPIIPLLGAYLIKFIENQTKKLKEETKKIEEQTNNEIVNNSLDRVESLIISSVTAIQQSFVDTLKKEGNFTEERQVEAFNMAKNRVLTLLKDEYIDIIQKVYGDYVSYVEIKIEQIVSESKEDKKK